jgi:hypothetical protein
MWGLSLLEKMQLTVEQLKERGDRRWAIHLDPFHSL